MPDLELRADYDHDGRLTGSQPEYGARTALPGALLVANSDVDRRAVPASVVAGPEMTLDYEQPTKNASDDELLAVRVGIVNRAAVAGSQLLLRVPGINGVRVRVYDDRGIILPVTDASAPGDHPVALPPGNQIDLRLESRAFPGSPFGRAMSLDTVFAPDNVDESSFVLQLVGRDPAGNESVFDAGNVSVAPVLFLDNGVRATKIYMCDQPDTQASLADVRAALAGTGVQLLTVPEDVSGKDTWLQDQFQPGLVLGADGWRDAIVHLPRLRANFFASQSTENLSRFVRTHFPARQICVMNDFLERQLTFADAAGRSQTLRFVECIALSTTMGRVFDLIRFVNESASMLDRSARPFRPTSWTNARTELPRLVQQLTAAISRAEPDASTEWSATLAGMRRAAETLSRQITSLLPQGTGGTTFVLPVGTRTIELGEQRANELFDRVQQLEGSGNYGGNIESAPPTADAPLGTIVIGNAIVNDSADHVDPDLLRFLSKQKQPVFQVDSTWLDVGHVDEMLTFVPDRNGSGASFAALRASAGLALRIIEACVGQYRAGLPENDPQRTDDRPSGVLKRTTDSGTSPMTHLMRGKLWAQVEPAASAAGQIPDILRPPRIYQRLSQSLNGGDPTDPRSGGINVHDIRFWPGPGPDRAYPADISIIELLWAERDDAGESVNSFIEETFLAPLDDALARQFGGPRVFQLPVLFDRIPRVDAWRDNHWAFATSAFTADVVNMQVLNGHLLVPRPYGPRLRAADALAVLTAVLHDTPNTEALARLLNARFLRRPALATTVCWIQRHDAVYRQTSSIGTVGTVFGGLTTIDDVVHQFKDGFPGVAEPQIRRRIQDANAANLLPDGRLRDGWRRWVIPENTVDVFEAYVQLVADALGLRLHFVDSWFYHVHFGGIHCGTNVLRVPDRGQLPNWWTV
jgi:hypothetical protein